MRTAPDVLMVLAQRGRAKASYYLWGKLLTLSPFYYVFLLQARARVRVRVRVRVRARVSQAGRCAPGWGWG